MIDYLLTALLWIYHFYVAAVVLVVILITAPTLQYIADLVRKGKW